MGHPAHIEILARRIGNLDAEIGRIAADVPVVQAARLHAVFVGGFGKPFLDLVQHFGLQGAFAVRPLLQNWRSAVAQREEVVLDSFITGVAPERAEYGLSARWGRTPRRSFRSCRRTGLSRRTWGRCP